MRNKDYFFSIVICIFFSSVLFAELTTETFENFTRIDIENSTACVDVINKCLRAPLNMFPGTLTQIAKGHGNFNSICSPYENYVLIGGDSGTLIYRTLSANPQFRLHPQSGTFTDVAILDVAFTVESGNATGYIIDSSGLVYSFNYNTLTIGAGQSLGTSKIKYAVKVLKSDKIWLCGENGLLLFFDGINVTDLNPSGSITETLYDIDVIPHNGKYFALCVGENGAIYYSNDAVNPESFYKLSPPSFKTNTLRSVHVLATNNIYVCGDAGAIYKFDGNEFQDLWSLLPDVLRTANFTSVKFLNTNMGFFCGDSGKAALTLDGAQSFIQTIPQFRNDIKSIDVTDSGWFYAVGEKSLFAKRQSTSSWFQIKLDRFRFTDQGGFVSGANLTDIKILTSEFMILTNDEGSTFFKGYHSGLDSFLPWTASDYYESGTGLVPPPFKVNKIAITDDKTVYLASNRNASGRRIFTGIKQYPSTIVFEAEGPVGSADILAIAAYDKYNLIACGLNGEVLIKKQNVWSSITLPQNPTLEAVACTDSNTMAGSLIGGTLNNQGVIYKYDGDSFTLLTNTISPVKSIQLLTSDTGFIGCSTGSVYLYKDNLFTEIPLSPALFSVLAMKAFSFRDILILSKNRIHLYKYEGGNFIEKYSQNSNNPDVNFNDFSLNKGFPLNNQAYGYICADKGYLYEMRDIRFESSSTLISKKLAQAVIKAQLMPESEINTNGGQVDIYFSSNGGTDFQKVEPGQIIRFTGTEIGASFIYKIDITGNNSLTPVINKLVISYEVDNVRPTPIPEIRHIDDAISPYDNDLFVWFDWDDSTTTNAEILGYYVSISTDNGVTWSKEFFTKESEFTIAPWSIFGSLAPEDGKTYRLSVAAYDSKGMRSIRTISNQNIIVDISKPNKGIVKHLNSSSLSNSERTVDEDEKIEFMFTGFSDNSGEIYHYILKVYEDGIQKPSNYIRLSQNERYFTIDVSQGNPYGYLGDGHYYSIEVRAVDKAWFTSDAAFTLPVYVYLSMPAGVTSVIHSDEVGAGIIANDGYDDDSSLFFDWRHGISNGPYDSYTVYIYRDNKLQETVKGVVNPYFTVEGALEGFTYEVIVEGITSQGVPARKSPTSEAVKVDYTPPYKMASISVYDEDSGNDEISPSLLYDDDGKITFKWSTQSPADNIAFSHYLVQFAHNKSLSYEFAFITEESTVTFPFTSPLNTLDTLLISVSGVDKCGLTGEPITIEAKVDRDAPPKIGIFYAWENSKSIRYTRNARLVFTFERVNDTGFGIKNYLIYYRQLNDRTLTEYKSYASLLSTEDHFTFEFDSFKVVKFYNKAVDFAGNCAPTTETYFICYSDSPPVLPYSISHTDEDTAVPGFDNDTVLTFIPNPHPPPDVKFVEIYIKKDDQTWPESPNRVYGPFSIEAILDGKADVFTYDVASTDTATYRMRLKYIGGNGLTSEVSIESPAVVVSARPGGDLWGYRPSPPVHIDSNLPQTVEAFYDDDTNVEFTISQAGAPASVYRYIIYYRIRDNTGAFTEGKKTYIIKPQSQEFIWSYNAFTNSNDDWGIIVSIKAEDISGNKSLESWSTEVIVLDLKAPSPAPEFASPPAQVDADDYDLVIQRESSDSHLSYYEIKGGLTYPDWTNIGIVTVGTAINVFLFQNARTTFYIRAVDVVGRKSGEGVVSIVESSNPPDKPGKPININKTGVDFDGNIWNNNNQLIFEWSPPSTPVVSYDIYIEQNKSGVFAFRGRTTSTRFTYSVADDSVYRIYIEAVDSFNRTTSSEVSDYIYTDFMTPEPDPVIMEAPYTIRTGVFTVELKVKSSDRYANPEHPPHAVIYQVKGGLIKDWVDIDKLPFKVPLSYEVVNTIELRARDFANNFTKVTKTKTKFLRIPLEAPLSPVHQYDLYPGYDIDGKPVYTWKRMNPVSEVREYEISICKRKSWETTETYVVLSRVKTNQFTVPATLIEDGDIIRIKLRAIDIAGYKGKDSGASLPVEIDLTPPRINFDESTPRNGSVDVKPDAIIKIKFTEMMKPETFKIPGAIEVTVNSEQCDGKIHYDFDKSIMTFKPFEPFGPSKIVKLKFNPPKNLSIYPEQAQRTYITDMAGHSLFGEIEYVFQTAQSQKLTVTTLAYPSPTRTGKVDIYYNLSEDCEKVIIEIYSADGHRIFKEDFLDTSYGKQVFQFEGFDKHGKALANGTYFYEITALNNDRKAQTKGKFIVIRGY